MHFAADGKLAIFLYQTHFVCKMWLLSLLTFISFLHIGSISISHDFIIKAQYVSFCKGDLSPLDWILKSYMNWTFFFFLQKVGPYICR